MNYPTVEWSDHAVDRGHERFGDCTQLTFPDELIATVALAHKAGETFKVAQGGVVYVCVVADDAKTKVVVKTIYENETTGNLDRGARGNKRLGACACRGSLRRRLDTRSPRSRTSDKLELKRHYVPGSHYSEDGEMDSPTQCPRKIYPNPGKIQELDE